MRPLRNLQIRLPGRSRRCGIRKKPRLDKPGGFWFNRRMKTAFIIAIGNELLSGQRVDTNSSWIQNQLLTLGIPVLGGCLVPDETNRIVTALEQASELADVVILTGGLGPTDDDLTRDALAEFLDKSLELRQDLLQEIERYFSRRDLTMAPTNLVQAYLPTGTVPISNTRGTAPGIHAEKDGKLFFSLPGVPAEMKTMVTDYICPILAADADRGVILIGKVRCFGLGESVIAEKLGDLMKRGRNPQINSTPHEGDIVLHIIAGAGDRPTAESMVAQDRDLICRLLGEAVYGFDEQTLPEAVGSELRRQGLKLALAESCTGGLLAKLITDVPGSSDYFLGGWVTYSNEAKIRDLGVSPQVLEQYGAVSEPVVRAMAETAAAKTGAEVTAAISGIAGPEGGTEEKPVGLVHIGLFFKGQTEAKAFRFSPTGRLSVRRRAAMTALNWIRLKLKI